MSKFYNLKYIDFIYLILFTIILFSFSRGTVVGDQERILFFILEYLNNDQILIDYLKNSKGECDLYPVCNYNYLGHHLGWFLYLLPIVKIIFFFSEIFNFKISNIELELLISLSDTFVLLLSFLLLFLFINKKYNFLYAISGLSFFTCSYGVGFLNGGFVEINLIFLICLKIIIKDFNSKNIILVSLIDILIIYLKLYSVIFIVLLLPLYKYSKKELVNYLFFVVIFIAPLIYLKLILPVDYLNFYQKGTSFDLTSIFENFLFFFFSPSLGLFFNTFLVFLILFNLKNKIIIYKFCIIMTLAILFSVYKDVSFWGGAGISGSRYIFPFLIIFYEEFIFLLKKINKILLKYIILIFMIIFYPSLDYKNTNILMVPEQTGVLIIKDVNNFPLDEFKFNGQIFAWQIMLNQIQNKPTNFKISENQYRIQSENIIPDTLLSKLIYVIDENKLKKSLFFEKYEKKYISLKSKKLRLEMLSLLNLLVIFLYLFIPFIIIKKYQNN